MTTDNDMIRRGDAKAACAPHMQATLDTVPAALPAAQGVRVKLQDIPSVAKEISIAPPMARALDVRAMILTGEMDTQQKLMRVEDVCRYIDRILAALEQPVATSDAPDEARYERHTVEALVKPPYHFDRYINGILMAEGVTIERENNLADAARVASSLASKGPNGEAPVLILASLRGGE